MILIKLAQSIRLPAGLALLCATLMLRQIIGAEPVGQDKFALRAAVEYQLAQSQFQTATNGSPTAWQFARACYNLAEFATNDENRANLAIQGIGACRQLLKEQPKSGAGHYWLGMNLGELARTELLGALALVRQMEEELKIAWSLDTSVDHAGAARSLGILYREAPGWPTSIGSKHKAKEWLERAAYAAPDFPENWLVLAESYWEWDESATAREKMQQLSNIWPAAQTNFTGVAWEADWADWNTRRLALQNKLDEQEPPNSTRKGQ